MDIKISRYSSATEFLTHTESWLSAFEAENNLALSIARQYRNDCSTSKTPNYWASIHYDNKLVGCVFRTPPQLISLTVMPRDVIPALVDDVQKVYSHLPGVNGPTREAEQFARQWAERHRQKTHVRTRLRIHKLTHVSFPGTVTPGALRQPFDSEITLVKDWVSEFAAIVGMGGNPSEAADRWIERERLFIWDDDGPRCMVASVRDTEHGACINAVYTPTALQRRGYASVAVATLSERLLRGGKRFCCLYTDIDNPTSNAIYRRIGYEPVRDDIHIEFKR